MDCIVWYCCIYIYTYRYVWHLPRAIASTNSVRIGSMFWSTMLSSWLDSRTKAVALIKPPSTHAVLRKCYSFFLSCKFCVGNFNVPMFVCHIPMLVGCVPISACHMTHTACWNLWTPIINLRSITWSIINIHQTSRQNLWFETKSIDSFGFHRLPQLGPCCKIWPPAENLKALQLGSTLRFPRWPTGKSNLVWWKFMCMWETWDKCLWKMIESSK